MPDARYAQRLTPETQTALFGVLREALNNIGKHAQASNVTVTLDLTGIEGENPHAKLQIQDDGVGFEHALLRGDTGGPGERIGLESMR